MMKWLLAAPSIDDLIRLLRAWRFWVLGTIVGALVGTAIYFIFPPAYRAQATVLVDYNLEKNWSEENDRKLFYYLERETRKLEEIAWSDALMESVAAIDGQVSIQELRDEKLQLSQPSEGGWHFWADDADAMRAEELASSWAIAFTEAAQNAERYTPGAEFNILLTQGENLPITRKIALGNYILVAVLSLLILSAFSVLFIKKA